MTIKKNNPKKPKKKLTLRRETVRDLTPVKDNTVRGGLAAVTEYHSCRNGFPC
jgi:hypothetical protein